MQGELFVKKFLVYFFCFIFICFLLPAILTKTEISASSENVEEPVKRYQNIGKTRRKI